MPIRDGAEFVAEEARLLAVLRSIGRNVPTGSLWFEPFSRYLAIVAGRVRALGGHPALIGPSAEGTVPANALPGAAGAPAKDDDCCREVARGLRLLLIVGVAVVVVLLLLILLLIVLD